MIKVFAPQANALRPDIHRVLFVLKPTRIHPAWERKIIGDVVENVDVQTLSAVKKSLLWKSYVQHFRANPRSASYMLALARHWGWSLWITGDKVN